MNHRRLASLARLVAGWWMEKVLFDLETWGFSIVMGIPNRSPLEGFKTMVLDPTKMDDLGYPLGHLHIFHIPQKDHPKNRWTLGFVTKKVK